MFSGFLLYVQYSDHVCICAKNVHMQLIDCITITCCIQLQMYTLHTCTSQVQCTFYSYVNGSYSTLFSSKLIMSYITVYRLHVRMYTMNNLAL